MLRGVRGFWISAVFGVLCFPPVNLWPLAWIVLIPFLSAAVSSTPKRAWKHGCGAGFVFFLGILYWIGLNSGAPYFLTIPSVLAIAAILATVWGLTAWAVSRTAAGRGLVWAVMLFVVLYQFQEVFWGIGEMGFPWAVWGLTQSASRVMIQMADVVDTFGLSFWVLTMNGLLFLVWKHHAVRGRVFGAAVVWAAVPIIYGIVVLSNFDFGPPLQVAAVQAGIPSDNKWQQSAEEIMDEHLSLTETLPVGETELCVWPETAVPIPVRYRWWACHRLRQLADSMQTAVFTGATDYDFEPDGSRKPYNAAFLIVPGQQELLRTTKVHLVPMGERIPGQKLFPLLGKLHLGQAEFIPGDSPTVFHTSTLPPCGGLICYEVVFPEIAAQLVEDGAELFMHITNDGWYGHSSGPYQHLQLTRLRAVAARRSIVRAANNGISALIDPTGRLVKRLGYDRTGVIRGTLPLRTGKTLAVRLYRYYPPLYAVMLLLVLGALLIKRRQDGVSKT